jgi:flagellar hook assembly protein FlgD
VGNYPNPFNAQTRIRFTLKTAGDVEVRIFNLLGQTVRQARLAGLTAGSHSWVWDGRVHRGGTAPSGVYFYRVESGGSAAVQRMVLLK